jgi:hypothetical protein
MMINERGYRNRRMGERVMTMNESGIGTGGGVSE